MAAGVLVRGEFRPGGVEREWCDPEVLRLLRRRSLARLRREVEPVEPRALGRFLPAWQGVGYLARWRRPAARGHRPAGGPGAAGERPRAGHPAGAGRAVQRPDARRAARRGRGGLGRRRVTRPRRWPGPAVACGPAGVPSAGVDAGRRFARRLRLRSPPPTTHGGSGGCRRRSSGTSPTGARRSTAEILAAVPRGPGTGRRSSANAAGAARRAVGPGLVGSADQRHVPAHPRPALAAVGTRPTGGATTAGCHGPRRPTGGCRPLVARGGSRRAPRWPSPVARHPRTPSDGTRSRSGCSTATGC